MDTRKLVAIVEHKDQGTLKFDVRSMNSSAKGYLYLFETNGDVTRFSSTSLSQYCSWKT